jgi:SHS2 domain-containing protein
LDENSGFTEIEHTADWALRLRGRDWPDLLRNAARGLSHLLAAEAPRNSTALEQRVIIEAGDRETLLVDWLAELAYWAEMERVVFYHFDLLQATPTYLEAVVRGNRVPDLDKHVKAVTYHNLVILETDNGLEATVVFDV